MDSDKELRNMVKALYDRGFSAKDIAEEVEIPSARVNKILSDYKQDLVASELRKKLFAKAKVKKKHKTKVIPASEIPRGYLW